MPEGLAYGGVLLALGVLLARRLGMFPAAPVLGLGALVVAFFRDPDREPPADPALVVAPADGRVTAVEGARISIFLSVFDVHVNRAPVAGRVAALDYRPGRFGNAMRARSAAQNEQNRITLETPSGAVLVTQIAGLLARRIVFWPRVGDRVERGQRIGMIKFGSRTDLVLPPGFEWLVRVGDHVRAGATPVARLP
jgi:phosphatidylserine decarboxylase